MSLLANNRNALILAMDHATTLGPVPGLEEPGVVIEAAVAAGADAVMTSFGIVKKYKEQLIGRIPTILRLDGGPSIYREDWMAYTEYSLLHSMETAVALGVDGVVLNMFVGIPVELDTYKNVARVANECLKANLFLVVEALACASERVPHPNAGKYMGAASRIAFEHGADLVKTYYSGDKQDFRQHVIEQCPAPVLIAGGPKMDSPAAAFQVVQEAIEAGARGIVFGRNIWQSGHTQAMIGAFRHIVHESGTVDGALERLG